MSSHLLRKVRRKEKPTSPKICGVFRPGDHRPRAHDRRQVAVDEGVPGHVRETDHLGHDLAAFIAFW
jgi:hypothetical protein